MPDRESPVGAAPSGLPLFSTDFSLAPLPEDADLERMVAALRAAQVVPRRLIAPMFVLLDITDECSLQCGYCYNQSGLTGRTRMSRERLFAIARELVDMRVFSVCVCGGEPTLHGDFVDVIRFLRRHDLLVASITNGQDLDEDLIGEMARNLAIVQVTLDGPDAETHDAVRGPGTFDKALKTIERLKAHGLRQLRIAFTCTRRNIDRFSGMLDLCLRIGAQDLRTMQLVPVGRAHRNQGFRAAPEQVARARQQVADWMADPAVMRRISVEWGTPHEHIRVGLAYGYLLGVNISAEGFYKISPYLPLAFGQAGRVSLKDAWVQGLGEGWRLPEARALFETITSVEDYERAYVSVLNHPEAHDGYLDLWRDPTGVRDGHGAGGRGALH
ncbi:radical SAM protein [Roseospira marina]|uniref:Radical SAM protein n=1 Tax=Roseospira marina TaxID=140057 RepID=A0A5M6I4R8_9PROT|nr:radical SAM protein [Roseospira marina]KAA5603226.1 radical SAM protein [Roseospira marina]MBB4316200.1 MoaA/NifB/PqqE/SkfB family radical SAM enzyme [Roseospira marina]MBB5089398.1 MoaA/NifB/PqqE/SkfB family radical SAM enzyme [Roseospira marina]